MAGEELRETEIENLDEAVLGKHHVLGFEIPVHDAGLVRLCETVGDLGGELQKLVERERTFNVAQRGAIDVFHDEKVGLVLDADLVDRDDVRMIQRRGGARFALEALEVRGVSEELLLEHLDGDRAAELEILRSVDRSHASRTQQGQDLEGPEARMRGTFHN